MKLAWQVDDADIAKVKAFFSKLQDNPVVRLRAATNLATNKQQITKDFFWQAMLSCMLTTQQRSSPNSPVIRFISAKPFPLTYEDCCRQVDIASYVTKKLTAFGGVRRSSIIGTEAKANFTYLHDHHWHHTLRHLDLVRVKPCQATERVAARFIAERFKGFGPKQSRNLLQFLGLSQFEIPIDSRITRWLNDFGFPMKLTATALADQSYYEFVSEGFQQLAAACEITPCLLDAAIFASFDGDRWTDENVIN